MKRIVWENKSNGQLCVTIPKNSGVNGGDVVSVKKEKIAKIVYTPIVGDLFHYGYLRVLQQANELGDFHICGILTDDAVKMYRKGTVTSYKERHAIVSALRDVDMVVPQHEKDPIENLKWIRESFPGSEIIVIYGSNWEKIPGSSVISKMGCKVVQPSFYEKLSTKNILKKIKKMEELEMKK